MDEIEVKSSRDYIFLNFFTILVPVILYPFITNIITPGEYGNYIFLQSIAMFTIAICNFGCLVGFKRNYFECKSNKEKHLLLTSIQIFIVGIFLIVIFINYIYEDQIFKFLNKSSSSQNFWLLILMGVSLDSISKYYLTFLVNEQNSKLYCFLLLLKNFFYIIFVLLFFFLDYKILSLIYSLLISNLILFLLILIYQLKKIQFAFSFNPIIKTIKISYPLIFRILFGQLNAKLDKILITLIAGVASTGVYAIAQSISYFIFQVITSLDKVFITSLNKKLFSGVRDLKEYLTPFLFISSVAAISIIMFNDIIYFLLIDEKYHGAGNLVIILSLYYFFLFFNKITGTQLIYLKKMWLIGNLFFLSVISNFFMNILFIKHFGMMGAAMATLITSIIFTLIQKYFADKNMELKMNNKSLYFICIFVLLVSIFQLFINYNFNNVFNLSIFLIKIFILIFFVSLAQILKLFEIKKFYKNFVKF